MATEKIRCSECGFEALLVSRGEGTKLIVDSLRQVQLCATLKGQSQTFSKAGPLGCPQFREELQRKKVSRTHSSSSDDKINGEKAGREQAAEQQAAEEQAPEGQATEEQAAAKLEGEQNPPTSRKPRRAKEAAEKEAGGPNTKPVCRSPKTKRAKSAEAIASATAARKDSGQAEAHTLD